MSTMRAEHGSLDQGCRVLMTTRGMLGLKLLGSAGRKCENGIGVSQL